MKKRTFVILKSLIVCSLLIFLFLPQSANAQGEVTKSTVKIPKSPKTVTPKPLKPTNSRPNYRSKADSSKTSKPPKSTTANLEITVNEDESGIEINRLENGAAQYVKSAVGAYSNDAVLFESLKPGDYLVKVRKNGFYDQELTVKLTAGKTARLNSFLKPSTGYMTVVSNVADVETEVQGIGIFTGKGVTQALPPQVYEVTITADDYEPVTQKVDIRAGQTTIVDGNLKLVDTKKLFQITENAYQNNLYEETIANGRLVLEKEPDDAKTNLLMGYAYFYTARPRESRFYLARAIGLQTEVEIPVKIYQKEKTSETLIDGALKISRGNLSFYSAKRPELNFNLAPAAIGKMNVIQDKNLSKPEAVEINASVVSGKKTEKKTLRIFPRQAFARVVAPNRAEIAACTGCENNKCLCQTEIRAVYELLLNWKSGSYPRRTSDFSAVAPPASSLTQFDGQNFSLKVPDNWSKVSQADNPTWFAPNGGVVRAQNQTQFIYALSVGVLPINANDLRAESERLYQSNLSANAYLRQTAAPKETIISGRKGLAASLAGFNVESGKEEFVWIYTTFTTDGNLFYLLTVTPFEERRAYRRAFRSILDSVNF